METPASGPALQELVCEHAALRRVATLVAQDTSPAQVFAAVTRETGELLGAQRSTLLRVETPEWARVVASWSNGEAPPVPVGHRGAIDEGRGILGRMLRSARPVRIEDFDEVGGVVAALMRDLGIRGAAGGPILLGGRLWGALTSRTRRGARSWRPRGPDSSKPPTRRGGASSAICTTARSSDWWPPRSSSRSWTSGWTAIRPGPGRSSPNGGSLLVSVSDDGVGGAEPERGSGLRGLVDRVQAVGGVLDLTSPPGRGTRLSVQLPAKVLGALNGH